MVNSKRMSKSKVAMIALAILLVLSLILTATGAWYTASEKSTPGEGQTGTFALADWLTAEFEGALDASFTVRRVTGVANSTAAGMEEDFADDTVYELIEPATGTTNYTVLPGDRIYFDVGAGEHLTVNASVDFWYMTYSNGAWSSLTAGNAGDDVVTLTSSRVEVPGNEHFVSGGSNSGYYVIDTNYDEDDAGNSVGTFSIAAGDQLAFIAVQRANIDAATATTMLNGMKTAALA